MEATLKRRIRKVAIVHLLITVLFVLVGLLQPAHGFSGSLEKRRIFEERLVWERAYQNIWKDVSFLLQPQFGVLSKIGDSVALQNFARSLPTWLFVTVLLSSIPIWSFCFGWLFVKFDNWLNHFPGLGRKIF